jgi:beta-galactosidase
VFNGLPADCVMNWEYQCFAAYNRRRLGLRTFNGDVLVGCVSDHKKEVFSAMTEIHCGRGDIIITTLDIPACLKGSKRYDKAVDKDGMNESMNTFNNAHANRANSVGLRLLLNMIRYAEKL